MNTDEQRKTATRIALTGVSTGAVAVIIMIAAVATSNSVAVVADLMATLFEWTAILLSWLTLRRLQRKGTFIFDYGYGKLENLVSLVMAIMMFMSLSIVIASAARRFAAPESISGLGIWLTLFAHAVYMGINSMLCYRTHMSWKTDPSTLLETQQRLFAVKTFCNVCMVTALALGLTFNRSRWAMFVDPTISLVIAASLFLYAYQIVTQNLGALLDHTLDESTQIIIIRELANFFDEYVALHGVRSRRSGNQVFVELFLEFDGSRSMSQIQEKIGLMKRRLEAAIPRSEVCIIPATDKPGTS